MREVSIYKKPFICLFVQIKGFYLVWKKTNYYSNIVYRSIVISSAFWCVSEMCHYYYSYYCERHGKLAYARCTYCYYPKYRLHLSERF